MRGVHKVTKVTTTCTATSPGGGGNEDETTSTDNDHNNSDPIETSSVFSTASRDSEADTAHNCTTDDDSGIISRSMH